MKQFLLFSLLIAGTFVSAVSAQDRVSLSIPDVVSAAGSGEICVPIIADSFPDIAAVDFSIGWDLTQVSFTETRLGDNPLGLTENTVAMPEADNIVVTFTTNDLMGITLSPGTVMLELCFNTTGDSGFTPLTFAGFRSPEFVQEGEFTAFPFDTFPGSITYGADVAASVLPGDTNNDGQVDHTDLLKIGLGHGINGPERLNASGDFTAQVAAIWPANFVDGLNLAYADANGDGAIADDDLNAVSANYGQVLDGGNFTPAGNGSSVVPEAPVLSVATNDVNAGETGTMIVSLGDGNDPLAVGYAMAFTLTYDPDQIDAGSLEVNFANAFLGEDLLTIARVNPAVPGRLEIALSRKDQINTTLPGGQVCRIDFQALNNNSSGDYTLDLAIVPNAFLLSDQSSAPITGSTASLMVMGTTSASEPAWGRELSIFPNPYTNGPLSIQGDLPAFDQVRVLDLQGRLLQSYPGNLRQLDLTNLPAATYLLQIEIDGESVNRKLIKR